MTGSASSVSVIRALGEWAFQLENCPYTPLAPVYIPAATLPIVLDVGTDNEKHLVDPLYIGWQRERVRGPEYDDFVESFVDAVRERWPHVLLHWEN